MKLGKEKLNELLYLFHDDDFRYGLIFKLIYIYGRNAGEVLKLKVKDIDFNENLISFELFDGRKSFMLHDDVRDDLVTFTSDLNSDDFLFVHVDESMDMAIKKLNYYLHKTIDSLNRHIDFGCPKLTTKDFRILRGQHLFLDGAEIHTIHELYNNSNLLTGTKNTINYNEMLQLKFPCNTLNTVFTDYTDTNIFNDHDFDKTDIFTVNTENETVILEVDYLENNVNIIAEPDNKDTELINQLNETLTEANMKSLRKMNPGNYKYINDLRILKN